MLGPMSLFLDSFWRAVMYCLHPRVILLSLLPLAVMVALSLGLGYFFWLPAVETVRAALESSSIITSIEGWLQGMGVGGLRTVLAPLLVIFAVTPLIVVASMLLVALLMAPALVALVARRRFNTLERKQGGSLLMSVLWSLGSTVLALIALLVSTPLWLLPPLILVLPPLIWGWLTYRVMAFDALAAHASSDERRELFRQHRGWLLGIGVVSGYLGAMPSLAWVSGSMVVAAFVYVVPVAIWIYMLVFAFSSLWFTHYCLAALQALRQAKAAALVQPLTPVSPPTPALPLPADTPATHHEQTH